MNRETNIRPDRAKKDIYELTRCTVAEYKAMAKQPVSLLLDNVRSMYNVGAMLRTADAFMLNEVVLCGITGCPPHPEITKTALGAEQSVDWRYEKDALRAVLDLKQQGWTICVLEQTHNSIPLQDYVMKGNDKCVLVAGNEVEGVDQRIVDVADVVLEIEQGGVKHSLNVSVSAGIALWQLVSRRS